MDENIWGILTNNLNTDRYARLLFQEITNPVLDIGCHWGYFSTLLAKNYDVTAIDINTDYLRIAKDVAKVNGVDINFAQVDAYALPYKSVSFGTVFLCEVLEHLDDPAPMVREAVRVAKNYLYITTPAKGIMPPGITKGHKQDFNLDDLIGMVKGLHNGLWAGCDRTFNYLLLRM